MLQAMHVMHALSEMLSQSHTMCYNPQTQNFDCHLIVRLINFPTWAQQWQVMCAQGFFTLHSALI